MKYEKITLRELVGGMLVEAGEKNPNIFVLDSDLAKSTTTNKFEAAFPDRFVELGIAEQNAMSAAAGIATEGKIPFYVNFAMFVSGTCWTQLRQICYANLNVKLIATHPGMDGSYDGASHHACEDIAILRALPNLKILDPANPEELRQAIELAINTNGPVYIRTARDYVPNVPATKPLEFGKLTINEDDGDDVALIYEGSAADLAYRSYNKCAEEGIKAKLVCVNSIKPVDKDGIIDIAKKVKRIVTIENHSVIGGLGGIVSECVSGLSTHAPVAMVGVQDTFTESGSLTAVKEKYGLTVENVLNHVKY